MARKTAQPPEQPLYSDTAAIERVLKAERDGVAALQQSAEEADRLQAQARAQAGDIDRRTDTLISRLHAAYLKKIQNDLLHYSQTDTLQADHPYDASALSEAARQVAARLTGET